MKLRVARLPELCAAGVLALCSIGTALAQSAVNQPEQLQPRARYTVLPARIYSEDIMPRTSSASLETWNGSFTYGGTSYGYNMVGAAPSTGSTATVPVYIIPIKLVVSRSGRTYTYDPENASGGNSGSNVVTSTVDSPVFGNLSYTLGGVNVGSTQYIDAFQRANFWGTVQSHPGSHLLLQTPVVEPEQTLTVPSYYGNVGSPFGYQVGEVDINWFDAQLPNLISKFGIQPNALPIFLTYDVYLTQNRQCCIGGYHSSEGNVGNLQSYAHFTYIDHANTFAQDVSALSHELGEWADDPLTVNYNGNNTPCGILEVGDPLENTANYGDHSYYFNGFTYHLQDLAFLRYFGAPASTGVNSWWSFDNASLSVCSNGS